VVRRFRALLIALVGMGLVAAGEGALGQDGRQDVVPEDRVELSFGRSEDYDYDPPEPGSYKLPALGFAANGPLLGPDGRERSLHDLMAEHITVLAFIYTRCTDPKGCPLSMGLLHDLYFVGQADPAIGKALRLITVSFDPDYDTPEVIGGYARAFTEDTTESGQWMFLTARSTAELKPILTAYDQPIGIKRDAEDPYGPFTHQLRVYLIDRQRRIRNIYSLGFLDPRLVITDVRTLLLERRNGRQGM
jgi:cytochrome oxidase Cu insertion factor (SCO1/SenC/PrrC family)